VLEFNFQHEIFSDSEFFVGYFDLGSLIEIGNKKHKVVAYTVSRVENIKFLS
jgi:hypothetical protein